MIDVVAALVLTGLAIGVAGALIFTSPVGQVGARRLAVGAAAWFLVVAGLAAAGLFSAASPVGTPAIAVAVVAPVLVLAIGAARVPSLRALTFGVPLAVLALVHVGRLLGAFFLALHADGRLPRTFATCAGWGDIGVALLALPVAWAVHRRVAGWWPLTLAWNTVGLVDLVAAVVLGVGSSSSPLRFIHESPDSGAMGTLPWLLIPGFLVPIFILAHLAVFVRLALDQRASPSPVPLRP
jgi:hypothetical protein